MQGLSLSFLATTYRRFGRLGKEFLWLALGNAGAVLGSLVSIRVLTEYLEPVEYGRLTLALTVTTMASQTLVGPLSSGAARFYAPAGEQRDMGGYLAAIYQFVRQVSGLTVVIALLAIAALHMLGRGSLGLLVLAALPFAVISGCNAFLNGVQNAARQRSIVALHQGVESWARLGGAVGSMAWLGASSVAALMGYSVAIAPVLASQYFFFRRLIGAVAPDAASRPQWRQQIWTYSWPLAITGLMTWAVFATQRWALEWFTTTEEVGYFTAIYQIGYAPVTLAGTMLMTLILPIVFSRAGDGTDKRRVVDVSHAITRLCILGCVLVVLCTGLAAAFHETIFRLMAAREYWGVSRYLPAAILAAGLMYVSMAFSMVVLADAQTRRLLPLNVFGNLLVIVATLLGTRFFGMDGLFAAMVGGALIHLAWAIYNSHKVLKRQVHE